MLPAKTVARDWRSGRWLHFLALACAMSLLAIWAQMVQSPLMRGLDNRLFDFYFTARGPKPARDIAETLPHTRDIVMVETTHQVPRPLLAKLIDKLRLARVVALDFMLVNDEATFSASERVWYRPEIARWKRETAILTRAVRRHGRVVLGTWPEENRTIATADRALENGAPHVADFSLHSALDLQWRHPPSLLWRSTWLHAHVVVDDEGGVTRRVKLFQNTADTRDKVEATPCMGLVLAALQSGMTPRQVRQLRIANRRLKLGNRLIAVDDDASIAIDFAGGRDSFSQLSNSIGYTQVLDDWEAEDFKDKIVIIGEVSRQAKEISLTPFGEMPSMHIHGHIAASLLQPSGPPRRIALTATALLALACSILLVVPLLRLPLWACFGAGAALIVALVIGGAWLFARHGLMLAGSAPIAAVLLTINGVALYEYGRARATLGRFIGREMVGRTMHPLANLRPGGREEVATALFCDLRGYSGLAETMSPTLLSRLINGYTTLLLQVAARHGGRAVDYQGDGIFVLFESALAGDEHARRAVAAGVEMQNLFAREARLWLNDEARNVVLEIGIGIESGPMLIGLLGSRDRLHLGAIGDAVNVAARLQALTRECGFGVLVTRRVRDAVAPHFDCISCGERSLKGRRQSVEIFGVGSVESIIGDGNARAVL